MGIHGRSRVGLSAFAAGLFCAVLTLAQDDQRALDAVREQIAALEARLARQITMRDRRIGELRDIERGIADANEELNRIAQSIRERRDELAALDRESAAAHGRLDAEAQALVRQVRLSYLTGRAELVKLLLSQESPAALGRMSVYYDYLNRARSERIAAVRADLATLARVIDATRRAQRELESLEAERQRELSRLQDRRDERRRIVAELERSIGAAGSQVGRLRAEEQRLSELLLELSEVMAGLPVDPDEAFPELAGRLAWPVPGRLSADFGQLRDGGPLRWNGVLLESPAGTEVRAVHYGRVVFSDWLPGLGMLIIVDHGGGYMSLYGHNEVLLRTPGDWVAPGEAIAQVGDSGGRPLASLYFEIRHDGDPVNPHTWIPQPPAPAGP